jgi:hypothetical protein
VSQRSGTLSAVFDVTDDAEDNFDGVCDLGDVFFVSDMVDEVSRMASGASFTFDKIVE